MDGSHRLASKNVFYENSAGVPFIMQYKGVIPAGVVDETSLITNGLDVLPTLCDYAGVAAPEYLLGRTIRPVAEGLATMPGVPTSSPRTTAAACCAAKRYKYCVYDNGELRESLVDLQEDPGEMNNLATTPEYLEVLESAPRLPAAVDRRVGRHRGQSLCDPA